MLFVFFWGEDPAVFGSGKIPLAIPAVDKYNILL
jgi:hypothetical protein